MKSNNTLPAQIASNLAKNVQELRVERGWSMDELAKKSGISKGSISHLEFGRYDPKLSTVLALAKVLGVSLERLLGKK